jgi:hypothetical protein
VIKKILGWTLVAMVLSLMLIFFWNGGGFRSIVQTVQSFPTSLPSLHDIVFGIASTSSGFLLPGQEDITSNLGIDIDVSDPYGGAYSMTVTDSAPPGDIQYGTPSPAVGRASLEAGNVHASNPQEEYVIVRAAYDNAGAIDVSGWTIQSMTSGKKLVIPLAASPFISGIVNRVGPAMLSPGAFALVSSGISPIGVSFRETICTGYLNQMQPFAPPLSNSCPSRERVIPYTESNVALYGESCFAYLRTLPACEFPGSVPANLSANCRNALANTFTYNGCVRAFQAAPDFSLSSWRLYGSYTKELWSSHDTLRLVDASGRVVDSIAY